MKRIFSWIAVLLCVVLLMPTAMAASPAAFTGIATRSGNAIHLTISTSSRQVHSGQIRIAYDKEQVTLTSANLGSALGGAELTVLDSNTVGEIALGFASRTAVSQGAVLEADFTALVTGTVGFAVSVEEYSLSTTVNADENGNTAVNQPGFDFTVTAQRTVYVPPTQDTPSETPVAEPTVSTGDVLENLETVTETTAKPSAETVDGVASTEITDAVADAILEQMDRYESSVVVIAPKTDPEDDITRMDVSMPAQMLQQIAESEAAPNLRVETPLGSVTVGNQGLSGLSEADIITVSVEKTAEDTMVVAVQADEEIVNEIPGGIRAVLSLADGEVAVLVDEDGNETIITKSLVEDGKTYVMLDGTATVKVIDNNKEFEDVHNEWFGTYVGFTSSHGLFNGVSETEFAPLNNISRAELATVLWNLESQASGEGGSEFADVPDGAYYAEAIEWASTNHIIGGKAPGVFDPTSSITRQEIVVMIYQYAKAMGVDNGSSASLDSFQDSGSVASWAEAAMEWAVSNHIINGTDKGELAPTATATRAEASAIMKLLVEYIVK